MKLEITLSFMQLLKREIARLNYILAKVACESTTLYRTRLKRKQWYSGQHFKLWILLLFMSLGIVP